MWARSSHCMELCRDHRKESRRQSCVRFCVKVRKMGDSRRSFLPSWLWRVILRPSIAHPDVRGLRAAFVVSVIPRPGEHLVQVPMADKEDDGAQRREHRDRRDRKFRVRFCVAVLLEADGDLLDRKRGIEWGRGKRSYNSPLSCSKTEHWSTSQLGQPAYGQPPCHKKSAERTIDAVRVQLSSKSTSRRPKISW